MKPLNLTSQRKAVYDIVCQSHDHPTAAEVMNRLVAQGHSLAYGTVYNSLRYLSDKHMIQELKLGESASRYDARMDDHQHILCENCGKVDEVLTHVPVDWMAAVSQETGYTISHAHVVFGGLCHSCKSNTLK